MLCDATFCSSTIFLDELRRQSADQSAVALDEMNVSHVYSRLTHPLIFIGGHPRYLFYFIYCWFTVECYMWCQIYILQFFALFLTNKCSVLGRPLVYILICTVDNKNKKTKKNMQYLHEERPDFREPGRSDFEIRVSCIT
jgi:hypothetical protein